MIAAILEEFERKLHMFTGVENPVISIEVPNQLFELLGQELAKGFVYLAKDSMSLTDQITLGGISVMRGKHD